MNFSQGAWQFSSSHMASFISAARLIVWDIFVMVPRSFSTPPQASHIGNCLRDGCDWFTATGKAHIIEPDFVECVLVREGRGLTRSCALPHVTLDVLHHTKVFYDNARELSWVGALQLST
jgi:hypothetical protein